MQRRLSIRFENNVFFIWNLVGGIDGDKKKHSFLTTVDVNVIYVKHIVKNGAIYRLM